MAVEDNLRSNMHLKYMKSSDKNLGDTIVKIAYKNKVNEFSTNDEYPRMWGLFNKVEIWEHGIQFMNKNQHLQLTEDFLQPYGCFLEDRMWIWLPTLPSLLDYNNPDKEIFYKDLKEEKVVSLE